MKIPENVIEEIKQLVVDKKQKEAIDKIKTETGMTLHDAKDCVDIITRKGEQISDYPPADLK